MKKTWIFTFIFLALLGAVLIIGNRLSQAEVRKEAQGDKPFQPVSHVVQLSDGRTAIKLDAATQSLIGLQTQKGTATIPSSAIVWQKDVPWVFVRVDAETFVRVKQDSVPSDSEIVTTAAQILLSEELKSSIKLSN